MLDGLDPVVGLQGGSDPVVGLPGGIDPFARASPHPQVLAELRELMAYRKRYMDTDVPILALGLSSRKNLCVHPSVADEGSRESVDAKCRQLTASWVRERAVSDGNIELCDFFEGHERAGSEALLPPGERGWAARVWTVPVWAARRCERKGRSRAGGGKVHKVRIQ
eukprot:363429-Chlamydomonas_euryale.AAC.3